jgi:hypothetical protein
VPIEVVLLDECDLPVTALPLKLFFAGDCSFRIAKDFKIDKPREVISCIKALDSFAVVLMRPANEIVGHTNIKRSMTTSCRM